MATVEKISGKNGISYRITVYSGVDCNGDRIRHRMTYKPEKGMTQRQIDKALERAKNDFERSIEQGFSLDKRITFKEYSEYVLGLKEQAGVKLRTIEFYKELSERTNQAIGHLAIQDIRPAHLNKFYANLMETGIRDIIEKAIPKEDFLQQIKSKKLSMSKLAQLAGVAQSTVNSSAKGNKIMKDRAEKIASASGIPFDQLFTIDKSQNEAKLSRTTINYYHRYIHPVLAQAEKEMLILYNPASRATPPKKEKSEVGTFQTSELIAIRDAAAQEPIKWQLAIHLLMITGCRRGEIVGLKWNCVDWNDSSIMIRNTLLYSPEKGVYESTTKTNQSRKIKLPKETMQMLKEYRLWQLETKLKCGELWKDTPYIFTGVCGGCMNPETLSGYLKKFEKRYHIPVHIHAHKFRHSMASVLYFSGADPVSISKRLGHANVSTTQDIYSHLIEQADTDSAEKIADAVFRSSRKTG